MTAIDELRDRMQWGLKAVDEARLFKGLSPSLAFWHQYYGEMALGVCREEIIEDARQGGPITFDWAPAGGSAPPGEIVRHPNGDITIGVEGRGPDCERFVPEALADLWKGEDSEP